MMTDGGRAETREVLLTEASYDDARSALDRVIEGLDLEDWLMGLKGKKVFVKPNMLGVFSPDQHATTHPSLVAAAVGVLREVGAEVTVGDNCGVGGYGLNQRVAKVTGIMEASDGAYVNVAKDILMARLDSRFMDRIPVSRAMLEADALISLPKMKTHSLTVVTGGVKNMFGLVAGAGKGKAHGSACGNKDFGEMLTSIYSLRPPDLTIMDAVVAMEGNGPSGGPLKKVGKLLASRNAVALDAVTCKIMGIPAEEVHHLRYANKKGLGPLDLESIRIIGSVPAGGNFKLPVTVHKYSFLGRFFNQRFFRPLSKTRLVLDPSKCKRCEICVQACPTGAMGMDGDFPRIDEGLCIKCLCCHELCPEHAWDFKGLFSRFMGGGRMFSWKKE